MPADGAQLMASATPEDEEVAEIASIVGSQPLAAAIHRSVSSALAIPFVHLSGGPGVRGVFQRSLSTAVRDIETHPRGKLFRRLIEHGPRNPDDPEATVSDGETTLSDPECGACVEFIYSHMVNRFKGELAELLALEPCIELVWGFLQSRSGSPRGHLYWGETVQERRRVSARTEGQEPWASFTKGADGLLVQEAAGQRRSLIVHGIVEVKSMALSKKTVLAQIERHMARLRGGVKLADREWPSGDIRLLGNAGGIGGQGALRILVLPSTWRVSRRWDTVETDTGRAMVFPERPESPAQTRTVELAPAVWRVTLGWSEEALEEAAYEMTFWYMSQVGEHLWSNRSLPKGWEYMTAEEAGRNAIKASLYSLPMRYITGRQERLAVRLYNVYSFGYPLGVDSREMLWPQDFPDTRP